MASYTFDKSYGVVPFVLTISNFIYSSTQVSFNYTVSLNNFVFVRFVIRDSNDTGLDVTDTITMNSSSNTILFSGLNLSEGNTFYLYTSISNESDQDSPDPLEFTITPSSIDTSLNLVASDASITTTESSTITAHVTAGAIDVSSGTLDVSFNGGVIYSGLTLDSSGQVSFDVSNNTAGTYPVQVTYSGTNGYNASSNTLNIEVYQPITPIVGLTGPLSALTNNVVQYTATVNYTSENFATPIVIPQNYSIDNNDYKLNQGTYYNRNDLINAFKSYLTDINGENIFIILNNIFDGENYYNGIGVIEWRKVNMSDDIFLTEEKNLILNYMNFDLDNAVVYIYNGELYYVSRPFIFASGDASGSVQLTDGTTILDTQSLVNGSATFDVSFNTTGSKTLQAVFPSQGSYADGSSNILSVQVTSSNSTPTDISLNNLTIAENAGDNAVVGTLSTTDPDTNNTFTYTLVDGEGDNASFNILDDQLRTNSSFNFETKSTYSVRIRSTDQGGLFTDKSFTITVSNVNEAPTNFVLSNSTISENNEVDAVIGTFSTTDPDVGDTFIYSLVDGTGDTDNSSFNILGSSLRANVVFNYETKNSYSIRVRSTDTSGNSFEKSFTITVEDTIEPPIVAWVVPPSSNSTATFIINTAYTTNFGICFKVEDTFNLSESIKYIRLALNSSSQSGTGSLTVELRSATTSTAYTAVAGTTVYASDQISFSLPNTTLTNFNVILNEAQIPNIANYKLQENTSYALILYNANKTFAIGRRTGYAENTTNNYYSVANGLTVLNTIRNNAKYSNTLSSFPTLSIAFGTSNSAPTDISLNNLTIAEDAGANAVVGTLSTTDPDTNNTFTYTLVPVDGSTDHASFDISGDLLIAKTSLDFDTQSTYSVRIRSTDQGGLSTEKSFTITVTDVNEVPPNSAPIGISLNNLTIAEHNAVNAVIGTFSTTDPDAGDTTFTYSLVSGDGATGNASFNILGNQLRASVIFDYETQTTYSIRVRSTDPSNNTFDKIFTITITDINDGPGTVYQPFGITGGKVSSQIIDLSSGSTFYFSDLQYPELIQISTVYRGVTGNLGDIDASGVQVSIISGVLNRNVIYSPISQSTQSSLGISGEFAMIFKIFDNSGNILETINPKTPMTIDVYFDTSGESILNITVNGNYAGFGTYVGKVGNKYKYRANILRGDGAIIGSRNKNIASGGSDPHITTIFGRKYDFHPSTRKNYTLFKTKDINITSHFSPYKNGIFYDKVNIELSKKEKIEVDFNKQKVKGSSKYIEVDESNKDLTNNIRYVNNTFDKTVGKMFNCKTFTKISYKGKNPMDLYIDYQTRYVHFRFPDTLPTIQEMSGLIVEPATRLD